MVDVSFFSAPLPGREGLPVRVLSLGREGVLLGKTMIPGRRGPIGEPGWVDVYCPGWGVHTVHVNDLAGEVDRGR